MIRVIGFDLDNTLYNQELFEFEVFEDIASEISKNFHIDKEEYLEELKQLYNTGEKEFLFDKAMAKIYGKLPINWDSFVKEYILSIYRNFIPKNISPYDGTVNILKKLKEENYKLVLITNGNSKVQNNKINGLDIRKYFDLILISDDYEPRRRKPDTHMFEEALSFFNIHSSQMVYIGDDLERDKASENVCIKFFNINEINLNLIREML
ncbi:HAD family hydrolase [Aliarcobacter cryaerophilus]|uniref:HAD family hydrolase n=1 Tax=Aliarcobacter cryaerophilus TaxID=28198 RepID=UPI003DA640CB